MRLIGSAATPILSVGGTGSGLTAVSDEKSFANFKQAGRGRSPMQICRRIEVRAIDALRNRIEARIKRSCWREGWTLA